MRKYSTLPPWILVGGTALLLIALLVSCSGNKNAAGASGSDGKMPLNWVGWYSGAENDGDIVKLMGEKFGVTFDVWSQGDGLTVRLVAGEVPDLFWVSTGNYRKYVQDGLVAELPWETVRRYAPNLYNGYLEDVGDYYLRQTEIDGKNYGLDVLDAETGGFRKLIIYRGDWIEAVGGKVPETLTEFEDLMYKFARNDPDRDGQRNTYGLSDWMLRTVYGAFGYIPDYWARKDGALVYGAIQPEMKDALALLAKWYKDGVLHPEYITGESTGGNGSVSNHFVNGQIGVTATDYLYFKPAFLEGEREGANITELKSINPAAADTLIYGNPPIGPGGKRGIQQESPLHTGFIVFGGHLVKEPEKMAKALEILNYCIADYDGFLLSRFGVEGTHWRMGSSGFPVGIGNFSEWGQITQQGGGAAFNLGSWLKPIVAKVNAEFAWGSSMPELQEYGIRNALFLGLPSATEYNAELNKLQTETYTDIITGRQPLSSFDAFVRQWKAQGGDILTREANQ